MLAFVGRKNKKKIEIANKNVIESNLKRHRLSIYENKIQINNMSVSLTNFKNKLRTFHYKINDVPIEESFAIS